MPYCKQCGKESIESFCDQSCKNKYENPFGALILECIPELVDEFILSSQANSIYYIRKRKKMEREIIPISVFQTHLKRRIGTYVLDPAIYLLFISEFNNRGYNWNKQGGYFKKKRD